jgi:sugar phosphate isomerase/epimerase
MKQCYLSTSLCKNQDLNEAINYCGALSNKFVELSAPHPFRSIEENSSLLRNFVAKGFKFTLHNYFPAPEKSFVLNIASDDPEIQLSCKKLVNNALKLSMIANSKIYGLHAGYLSKAKTKHDGDFEFDNNQISYNKGLDNAIKFINEILKKFKKKKIIFLIENLFPSIARNSSLNCDFNQIKDLMDNVPKEVGLLLDLGHLNISSKIMEFNRHKFLDKYLERYGDRLHEVHISENNGLKDEHKALIGNSWQYDAIKKIAEIRKKKPLSDIFYCLESRNANSEELKDNLDKINSLIS